MAREKDRIRAIASYDPFPEVDEMDWQAIEEKLGRNFDANERQEIRDCGEEYRSQFAMQEQGAWESRVHEVREQLLAAFHDVQVSIDRLMPPDGHSPYDLSMLDEEGVRVLDEEDIRVLNCLTLAYASESWLREDLADIRSRCIRASNAIKDGRTNIPAPTATTPHVAGLAAFVMCVTYKAEVTPARKNQQSWGTPGKEYSRWGYSVGPQSGQFRLLAETVLETNATTKQLKQAFPCAIEYLRSNLALAKARGRLEKVAKIEKHPLLQPVPS